MVVSGLGLGVGPDSSRAPSFGSCNNLSGFPCLWIEHNGRTFLPECREDKPRRIMAHAARSLNVSACCEPFRVAVWRLRHREVPQHPQKTGMAGPELEVQTADTWQSIINKDDDPGCLWPVFFRSSARLPSALGHWREDTSACPGLSSLRYLAEARGITFDQSVLRVMHGKPCSLALTFCRERTDAC